MNQSVSYENAVEVEKDLDLKKEMLAWEITIGDGLDDEEWIK